MIGQRKVARAAECETLRDGVLETIGVSWIQRLFEHAGKAAFERVRQSPAYQEIERRNRLANPIVTVAQVLAGSPADDETLARRLKARFKDPEAAEFALQQLERNRSNFLDDRAYRLLYAAARGGPVPPVDIRAEASLKSQERLARLPLREAFASLAELAPGLRTLEARVTNGSWRDDKQGTDVDAYVTDRTSEILKGGSDRDPVLASAVAQFIAQQYLLLISGEEVLGDLDSPVLSGDDVPI